MVRCLLTLSVLGWVLVSSEAARFLSTSLGSLDELNLPEDNLQRLLQDDGSTSPMEFCQLLLEILPSVLGYACSCNALENDAVRLDCMHLCQVCNSDFSSCGTTNLSVVFLDIWDDGQPAVTNDTRSIQYDGRANRTEYISIRKFNCDDLPCNSCAASINNQECNNCLVCGFDAFEVDCENVAIGSSFNSCAGAPIEGVFAALDYYDVACSPPSNDLCINASSASAGEQAEGTFLGATSDTSTIPLCSSVGFNYDFTVWYNVVGTGNLLHASTCGGTAPLPTGVAVYGGSCDQLECVDGSQSQCDDFINSAFSWLSVEGETYFIVVSGVLDTAGDFTLTLSEFPADNGACNMVSDLVIDGPAILGGLVVEPSGGRPGTCNIDLLVSADAWYRVESAVDTLLRVSTCSGITNTNTGLSVLEGTCESLNCIAQIVPFDRPVGCLGNGNVLEFHATAGTAYNVLVEGEPYGLATFEILVEPLDPPANNYCEDAEILLADTMVEGDLTDATINAGMGDPPSCDGHREANVWYVVEGSGEHLRAIACSNDFFQAISVYTGTCGELQCHAVAIYDSDICNGGGFSVAWEGGMGTTYYIMVRTWGGQGPFDFSLSSFISIENDVCDGAIGLMPNTYTEGSMVNATGGDDGCNDPYLDDITVWYYIDGTDSLLQVSTCNDFGFSGTLYIASGSCGELDCVAESSTDEPCEAQTAVWFAESGERYYILVTAYEPSDIQFFSLNVTEHSLASNDVCETAQTVMVEDSPVFGSTLPALPDDLPGFPCGVPGSAGVWYQLVGTGQVVQISTCSVLLAMNSFIEVFQGFCDSLACIETGLTDSQCSLSPYLPTTARWLAMEGITYYILVQAASSSHRGDFELLLTTLDIAKNDNCIDAMEMVPNDGKIVGSTAAATKSGVSHCLSLDDSNDVWYRVTGTGAELVASLCHEETNYDSVLTVYDAYMGSCDNLSCLVANDDSCDLSSEVKWNSTKGDAYLIRVHGYHENSDGDFGLTLTGRIPPSNDFCVDAISVEVDGDMLVGSTENATATDISDCLDVGASPDVWYKVVGNGDTLSASLCHVETNFDSVISVFATSNDSSDSADSVDSCEDALSCIEYNDDWCGLASDVQWSSISGETYYIRVRGYEMSGGNFGLTVSTIVIAENDACMDATPIPADGNVIPGTTERATRSGITHCNFGVDSPDVWYQVEGTGSTLTASLCHTETNFDTLLSVYAGESCDNLGCVGHNDDWCNSESEVEFLTEPGVTYWIRVHSYYFWTRGEFGLSVTGPEERWNDDCVDAAELRPGQIVTGNTDSASYSGLEACFPASTGTSPDLWYRITGTGEHMTLSTCSDNTDFDTQLSVYGVSDIDQECDSLTCWDGSDDACYSSASEVDWQSTMGHVYYARVHGYGENHGQFELSLTAGEDNGNDSCETAVQVMNGMTVQGNTIYASPDALVSWCDGNTSVQANGIWYEVLGDGGRYIASTCDDGVGFATQISIFTGNCLEVSAGMAYLECVDTAVTMCGNQSEVEWQTTVGTIYYIMVRGSSPTQHGSLYLTAYGVGTTSEDEGGNA